MEKLAFVTGVLTDNGLSLEVQEFEVLKENDNALVLDTPDFKTIIKKESKYKDSLNKSRISEFTTKGILEVSGYYEDKAMAKEMAKKEVWQHLKDKAKFLDELAEKIGR